MALHEEEVYQAVREARQKMRGKANERQQQPKESTMGDPSMGGMGDRSGG